MHVPLLDLKAQYSTIKEEIRETLDKICESQKFVLGEDVTTFEEKIAAYSDTNFAVGVASGTDALLLSLMAEHISAGDEVITTPYTFFSTAGSITRLGAKPVFVDIQPDTYNIDPQLIEEKINKNTKAIIPVHLYGQCAEMNQILGIAKKYNLAIIEDAAQAIGAGYHEKKAGSIGDYGCLSFFPSKNLGGYGDGGMITTNSKEKANLLKILRVHGSNPKYYHKHVGCNSRLDTIQAVILTVKLKYLEEWTKSRRANAERYNKLINESSLADYIKTPDEQSYNRHIYNQYTIRLKQRDELISYLRKNNIGSEIYYPLPLHMQECFNYLGGKKGDFPVSETAAHETMSLPIYPEMTENQQDYVLDIIKGFFGCK